MALGTIFLYQLVTHNTKWKTWFFWPSTFIIDEPLPSHWTERYSDWTYRTHFIFIRSKYQHWNVFFFSVRSTDATCSSFLMKYKCVHTHSIRAHCPHCIPSYLDVVYWLGFPTFSYQCFSFGCIRLYFWQCIAWQKNTQKKTHMYSNKKKNAWRWPMHPDNT